MATDLKQKVKCVCSHYISLKRMEKHQQSKYHNDRLVSKKKTQPTPEKVDLYEEHKSNYNCCSKCYKVKIPDIYFNKSTDICKACEEIALNQDKNLQTL